MWPNAKSDRQNKINSTTTKKTAPWRNKQHRVKVEVERFHWNGHSIGFCPRTQKLETPYKTPLFTLAVKGLNHLLTGKFWCGLKLMLWSPKKKNNHVCTNIFKLAFIFSEIKNNYFFFQIKLYIIFITI